MWCLLQDGVILGAVGAYDWNGTVVMHTGKETIVPENNQFYDPKTEAGYERLAGYLGELILLLLLPLILLLVLLLLLLLLEFPLYLIPFRPVSLKHSLTTGGHYLTDSRIKGETKPETTGV